MRTIHAMKGRFAGTAALVALLVCMTAAPAPAQTQQDGLVNVAVTDNVVQIPIGVAANVCGVSAAVLSAAIAANDVDCEAFADADAISQGGGGNGNTRQEGLVNVAVTDNVLQVPVGIALNVCGVGVAVLSEFVGSNDVACEARSRSNARA